MAEALISVLLKQLASVTYQHVGEEVKLVLNALKDVKEFEANLKVILAVLEDAEQRQVKEASVRNWLEELKDVSYKMDNVLDEWKTEILKQQIEKQEEHSGSTSLVIDKKKKAVCNLYNLQTLRLYFCSKLEGLPQSMGKLINLKHLYVYGCDQLKYLPKGIGRLTNLRRLDRCPVGGGKDDDEVFKLGDLRNLDQLRELGIEIDGEVQVATGEGEKASPLGNKQQLSKLIIRFVGCGSSAKTLNFLRPHPNLEFLYIRGHDESTAPDWIMSLNNLRFLCLKWLKGCEVLPHLGKLPSLEIFWLVGMKRVKKVGVEFLGIEKETSSASSCITIFPKLKKLKFSSMSAWKEWKEEDSDITIMPCLSSLEIYFCSRLKTLPNFLRKTPLQTLDIKYSRILARGCRKGRGKEWPKISHIPNVAIEPEYSDSDFDDEGEGIVEAEDAVELPERPSTCGERVKA